MTRSILAVRTPTATSVPVNTVAPVISLASDWATLSCTTGTWTNSPSGYTYQWKRAGVNISGATSSTYTTTGNDGASHTDYGPAITCEVTASNGAGGGSPAASNSLSYLPTAESTCKRFLDPSLLSNGAIATYADQAGAPSYAQATGGKQPSKSATSLNGTPGVTFDGVDDYMETASTHNLSGQSGMRVLFGASDTTTGSSTTIIMGHAAAAIYTPGSKGFVVAANDGVANTVEGATSGDGVGTHLGARFVSASLASATVVHVGHDSSRSDGVAYIRIDGTAMSLSTVISTCVSGDLGNVKDYMGAHLDGTSFPWAGTVGVVVWLTGVSPDAVSARVEQFIAWRSGKSPL